MRCGFEILASSSSCISLTAGFEVNLISGNRCPNRVLLSPGCRSESQGQSFKKIMLLGPHPKVIEFECPRANVGIIYFRSSPDGSSAYGGLKAAAPVHPHTLN